MSRYYWHCPTCESEADDSSRTGVELFGQNHRCASPVQQKLVVPWVPSLNVVRLAGHRRNRLAGVGRG